MSVSYFKGSRAGDMPGKERTGQEAEPVERAQYIHDSRSDGRNRTRLGDEEPCPGIKKSGKGAVGVTHINIFTACPRLDGAEFRVGQCAGKRQEATYDPDQVDQSGGANVFHHHARYAENPA